MEVLFDIEGNNLLPFITEIHCIALKRIGIDTTPKLFTKDQLKEASEILEKASTLIAHNGCGYDFHVLERFFNIDIWNKILVDTLLCYRIIEPWRTKYSLESLGSEYGLAKIHLGEDDTQEETWEVYTEEMGIRCKSDVDILERVYFNVTQSYLLEEEYRELFNYTHRFALIKGLQYSNGVSINLDQVKKTVKEIKPQLDKAKKELAKLKDGWYSYNYRIAKVNNKAKNIKTGDIVVESEFTEFNVDSTQHWMRYLKEKYNYTPPLIRRKGKKEPTPSLNKEVLEELQYTYTELQPLLEYRACNKVYGMLYEDKDSIYNGYKNGRIYGQVKPDAARSGRCTHSRPNLANKPRPRKDSNGVELKGYKGKFGFEFRRCFVASESYTMIGFDASALELAMLAYFMQDPEFIQALDNDPHSFNQKKAKLPTRDDAKTFIYGFLYGAGDAKIGSITGKGKAEGRQIKENFLKGLPKLKKLIDTLQKDFYNQGYLTGLDNRKLYPSAAHASLNILLQGAGAVVLKYMSNNIYNIMKEEGYIYDKDYRFLLDVHDEVQSEVKIGLEEKYKEILIKACELTNKQLKLNNLFRIDIKQGTDWSMTH